MSRIAGVVIPGTPHHITQRGNRREDVFLEDGDRQRYLQLLLEYSVKHELRIPAYCLMTNHVHLVCIPERTGTISSVFRTLDLRYTQHFNWSRHVSGRLWQGRPFSCVLDDEHLWAAVRYVERNPVRARMVRKAENYAWSSAATHCGLRSDALLSPFPGKFPVSTPDWSAWLAEKDDEKILATIRFCTRTGRPAGNRKFVAVMESRLGRRLLARSIGRPKKRKTEAK